MNKRVKNWAITIMIFIVIIILGYFSFFNNKQMDGKRDITIGIMSESKADDEIWESVQQTAKSKYKINLHFKKFTDYSQPNKALTQHEVDLNAFQHYAFLDEWNKKNNTNIVSIGRTTISPIKIYSKKIKNIKNIKDGATITIPNDATNESRSLLVLKNAGLIKLKRNNSLLTLKDIKENPKNLKIKEVDASQTAHTLSDVDAAVVNNTYAVTAHLSDKEAIYTEPLNKDSKQWINIISANKDQRNNKYYQDVVRSYQTKKTAKLLNKYYGNSTVPAWNKNFDK